MLVSETKNEPATVYFLQAENEPILPGLERPAAEIIWTAPAHSCYFSDLEYPKSSRKRTGL